MTSADAPAVRAVVWDMGGVMYRYFTEVLLDEAADRGLDVDALALGPTGRLPDADYELMDAGRIDEAAYLARVRQRLAEAGTDVDPVVEIDWSRQRRPATWRLIEAIHTSGLAQALLTNDASKWLGERWWDTWPSVHLFDEIIDVAELGVRKPAPEPYVAAADALGLRPTACVFVDDLRVNCRGAEAVGMASHHVDIRDPDAAMARLAARIELGVSPGTVAGAPARSPRADP